MADEDVSVAIAPAFAAKAQAATHIWAQAISDGSYKSEFTAGIPTNKLNGYTPPKLCVFAKTCIVPPESTEACSVIEPVANFGQAVVMGSTAIASTEGSATLGRVAGQVALEALGKAWRLYTASAWTT